MMQLGKIVRNILNRFSLQSAKESTSGSGEKKDTAWYRRFWLEILMGIALALILTFLYPKGKTFQFADLKEGKVYVGPEIIAPFTFPVNKSEQEYNHDILVARRNVAPVFQKEAKISDSALVSLNDFLKKVSVLLKSPAAERTDLETLIRDLGLTLSEESLDQLWKGFSTEPARNGELVARRTAAFEDIRESVYLLTAEFFSAGIIDLQKSKMELPQGKISVRENGQEVLEELTFYRDVPETLEALLEKLRAMPNLNEEQIKVAYQMAQHFIVPNVLFNKEETDIRIEDAVANVAIAKDQVLAGERIINSHERITKVHIDKLRSLAMERAARGESGNFWSKIKPTLGKFFLNILLLFVLTIFLHRHRRKTLQDRNNVLLIGLAILFIAFVTFLLSKFNLSIYLAPIAVSAIIVTIFFDVITGFIVSVIVALVVGAMRGGEFSITFVSLFVCAIAILSVSKVKNRNWILRSFLMISGAYVVAITVQSLINYIPLKDTLRDCGFGVFNGFFSPIFAYGLIIILEYGFDMTTDMTLLELSDLNQPLLRQLSIRAPGTYHHSLMVGNLAEAAAEAIGANALLARVGAYYHDIGKMEKPEYFVENQTKGRNPQENLTPSMSSLILANHVRKGTEMAQRHNLPKEIQAFITEHHGTGLMSYFYKKALEATTEDNVSENEFRYPGPRPQTRETAIVMLADAVEATSRTLKDPPPSRVKAVVEQLIDERFKSGELDESPLTLQDLLKISGAFQKILNGIFHGRIEYPSIGGKAEKQ